jgi:hypothetical protein
MMSNPLAELNVLYRIRQIIEPEPGKLMQSELVDAVRQLRDERDKLRAKVERLPKTADKVPVVPNVDPIYIDPNENGWMGEKPPLGSFDEIDRYLPEPVWEITTWAWYGDHIAFTHEGWDEAYDHWAGPFYASLEAAEAATKEAK